MFRVGHDNALFRIKSPYSSYSGFFPAQTMEFCEVDFITVCILKKKEVFLSSLEILVDKENLFLGK